MSIEDWNGPITITALYCPPKHSISKKQYIKFYKTLGNRFLAGGDYNAKHPHWRSRVETHKGKQLLLAMQEMKLGHKSTGQPTYWPTDRRKVPDLIDFCVTKGIAENHLVAESCYDLSSDHSPIIITASTKIIDRELVSRLYNKNTNWNKYGTLINNTVTCNIPLKNADEITNAIEKFNEAIITAAKEATPMRVQNKQQQHCPIKVKDKIEAKRKLRKRWQTTRSPIDKAKLNKATKEIKILLENIKNDSIQDYLLNLDNNRETDYSLWKATRKLKRPQQHIPPIKKVNGKWANSDKDKAMTFAEHLQNTFTPYQQDIDDTENNEIIDYLQSPLQMNLPIKNFTVREVERTIFKEINPNKAPGYDKIGGKLLMELTEKGIRYITYLFNAILRTNHFPEQWKKAQIIMIPKPGKDPNLVQSYRPISLLPILSKIFEKLFIKRLKPIIIQRKLIPNHQFDFREQHGTTEQVHRVVNKISRDLENKRYCSAAFLDIAQAFDKVWHDGLLYKLKQQLPHHYFQILKSYLKDRKFMVKDTGRNVQN